MNNVPEFIAFIYYLCILFAFGSFFVTIRFVLPLQIKQAGVRNGLSGLRKKLLAKGYISLLVSTMVIVLLSARFFITDTNIARYLIVGLLLAFSVVWFIKQLIDSLIYHTQFTLEQLLLHDMMANVEDRWREEEKNGSHKKRNS